MKKERKLVRLSNGVVDYEDGIGQILLHLRSLAINNPAQFELLAHFVAGKSDDLPDYLVAKLKKINFLKEDDPPVLYDDVRDVVECCSQWRGNRAYFESMGLFHKNQTNLKLSDEE